jgi:hypothetical protein
MRLQKQVIRPKYQQRFVFSAAAAAAAAEAEALQCCTFARRRRITCKHARFVKAFSI